MMQRVSEELLVYPTVKEARLYERVRNYKVVCKTCERKCVVEEGKPGFCKTKANINGKLYTFVYGDASSLSANPIEKKPFFHFYPGTYALTMGTWSCNFTCPWCQNYEISKREPNLNFANYLSPKDFVEQAIVLNCKGTSLSFNEPTLLFEYALDLFPLACKRNLYNTYVSNGYMSLEALRMLKDAGMHAINFDVKGCKKEVMSYCNANVDIVWRNIREAKRLAMHVEVVCLIIPTVNDSEDSIKEIVSKHLKETDEFTPIHFTRFYPNYKMLDKPITPIETLERAYELARKEGINYAYIGNVLGHRFENTYCHNCGKLIIERYGFSIVKFKVKEGKCEYCGVNLPIIT
jgi:pyruvate formate lyase activating enzyme